MLRLAVAGSRLKSCHHISTTNVYETPSLLAKPSVPPREWGRCCHPPSSPFGHLWFPAAMTCSSPPSLALELLDLTVTEGIDGGYSQSKWVADAMMGNARRRGIPVSVYRPGFITGARLTVCMCVSGEHEGFRFSHEKGVTHRCNVLQNLPEGAAIPNFAPAQQPRP